MAQENQAFTYDVHGRLATVARTTGSTTRTTNYVLDDADNRTSRATTISSGLAAETPEETTAADAPDATPVETPQAGAPAPPPPDSSETITPDDHQ